jgi:penicillin-binding protein 1A
VNDWTLPPYRFDDKPTGQKPAGPPVFGSAPPPPPPPPEEPFRADLKHARAKARARRHRWILDGALVV